MNTGGFPSDSQMDRELLYTIPVTIVDYTLYT
jgi:hypothetical protein